MALSRPAEQYGPSDNAASSSSSTRASGSDAIAALGKCKGQAQLAAWLDQYATRSPSPSTQQNEGTPADAINITATNITATNVTATNVTATTTSKLQDTSAALRDLSLSLSSVRDASRTELDQIIASLVSTIPKIGIELKLMSETATTLQSRLHALQTQSSTKDTCADTALASIAALSKAKAGLIEARHALRQAQAWSTLESQVTVLLSEQSWQQAVDRVAKAADSLRLFSGSHKSNQERTALLQSLTSRIHEQLLPVLQQAITAREAEKVSQMASLLAQTHNGVSTFFQVYTDTRSQALLSRWAQTASETNEKSLPAQLTRLYADLLALLGEERLASSSLFTDPNRATQLLTAHILYSLDPPIHACIQHATRAPDLETFLAALTDAYKATEDAVRAVQSILPQSRSKQPSTDQEADTCTSLIDSTLLALETTEKPWLRLMIEPFIPYQTRLATFEAEAMQSRLQSLQASTTCTSPSVSAASTQASQVVKAALRRSTALTKSLATPLLLPSLDAVFETAMSSARSELELELQRTLTSTQGRIRRIHLSAGPGQAVLTYDERGDVLTSADWDEFRKATEKLSACRDAMAAVRGLEEAIAYQISELATIVKPAAQGKDQDVVDFTTPTSALATSSLNSSRLHELIAKSKRLLSAASWNTCSSDHVLLPIARDSVLWIASAVQTFQHQLVLSQFLPEFELYPSLQIWRSNKHPSIVNEYDLAMPKFSLSPTEAMARVGEAMLNLPRLFEGYADEALLFCLDSSKKGEGGENIRNVEKEMAVKDTASAAETRSSMHRQAFSTTTVPSCLGTCSDTTAAAGEESEADAGVLSQYLRSLLTQLLTHFLTSVLSSLPLLSDMGAAQLAADLDYLSNIASVIYAESERILRFWKKAAELSTDTGKVLVSTYLVHTGTEKNEKPSDQLDAWTNEQVQAFCNSHAFASVARLRGWM
ncbi:hypothetical protein NDA10_007802 [Ustilago hordei]|uniref:Conserved oligomeric Golgi complex subunit 7 n=1 Tax=Ustilago hordei TaxID=120017 RepID=I2FTL6_USTHO|nr:uncharacterized protein UHO2_06242 [Ustilago hordei]KAJ1037748.1 hypothetical protein NDA10_007802 [Ustilago hordei]CCF50259.1 uncharacterized protein UHOR_07840 [Ustilago hordei]SYW87025.1 uncharacterized protein UHO2_06242 [Ustilago hordei]